MSVERIRHELQRFFYPAYENIYGTENTHINPVFRIFVRRSHIFQLHQLRYMSFIQNRRC